MAGYDIQQPDIVGSFLGRMRDAQQFGQAQQDRETNLSRLRTQDQRSQVTFDEERAAKNAEKVASIAYSLDTPEKWTSFLSDPKNRQEFGLPDTIANLPFTAREQVIAKAQTLQQKQAQQMSERKFGLEEQQTAAQIAASRANASQSYAAADASRATADYTRGGRGQSTKPLPVGLQKAENDMLEKVQIASNNNADVTNIMGQIDNGQLDPGLLSNKYSEAKSFFGAVDPNDQNTRNYNSFVTTMERLRNESLRLNKGVQTDGDAQRAWAELFKNINDKTIVRDQLARISMLNERAAKQHASLVRNQRRNFFGDRYEEPNWEELGVDATMFEDRKPATSFVRGGAGIFSQGPAAGGQPQQAQSALPSPSAAATMQGGGRMPGSGGGSAGAPLQEGQRGVSKSGKPMIVRGGKWAYQ